jgi:diguanylate cyclase (GGDEF)-like protein/PAS domain S-box-containing protein
MAGRAGSTGRLRGDESRRGRSDSTPGASRTPRSATTSVDSRVGAALDDAESLHLLFDHVSDAVFATDVANRITRWTVSAERLFGYSADEAIGRSFGDLLPFELEDDGGEPTLLDAIEAGHSWRGTGTVRLRDGSKLWIGSAVDPIIVDGQLRGSVSVSRDVTSMRDARLRLADQERFVASVLDVVGALVVVLDAQGRVTRFNGACERLSGYGFDEAVGRFIWDLVIPPDEIEGVRSEVADLQAGAFPSSHENHWLTRSGAKRLIAWENTCLTDDRGVVTHLIATGLDITEARRRHEALRGIETVGHLLAEQGPVPAALDAVLGEMQARMAYPFLSLYLDDGPGLRLAARRGYRAIPEGIAAGAGIVGRVRRTGQAEFVPDVAKDHDYVAGNEAVTSAIAVPLAGDGPTLGVLKIESTRPQPLAEGDLQFVRTIADRLSIALRRQQAQEALIERTRLFAALAEFAAAVNAIQDPERLVAALVDAVGPVVPSDAVIVTTLDHSDGQYRVRAVRGLSQEAVGTVITPGEGTLGRVIRERAVIYTDRLPRASYTASLREYMPYDAIRAMAVPLIGDGAILGLITVGRADTDLVFTQAEREIFALLGSHAALALANAYLVEEVRTLAIHDALTGLYNRRHFDAALDLAVARFKRRKRPGGLAAIMFDLDHFGDFNRRHGHLAGDALLRAFGDILRGRLRSSDLVARYGGEEFVAILEDTTLLEAARMAEEVRRELEARSVPGADGQPLHATVSAGCAVMDPADQTKESLIGLADQRLFVAKGEGRNRVVADRGRSKRPAGVSR